MLAIVSSSEWQMDGHTLPAHLMCVLQRHAWCVCWWGSGRPSCRPPIGCSERTLGCWNLSRPEQISPHSSFGWPLTLTPIILSGRPERLSSAANRLFCSGDVESDGRRDCVIMDLLNWSKFCLSVVYFILSRFCYSPSGVSADMLLCVFLTRKWYSSVFIVKTLFPAALTVRKSPWKSARNVEAHVCYPLRSYNAAHYVLSVIFIG